MSLDSIKRTQTMQFVRRQWPAEVDALPEVRRLLRDWLRQFALPPEPADNLLLALCEAICNAMRHAYPADDSGVVDLVAWVEGGVFNAEVSDRGSWRGGKALDSGLGIELMRHFVDSVTLTFSESGTRVRFRQGLHD